MIYSSINIQLLSILYHQPLSKNVTLCLIYFFSWNMSEFHISYFLFYFFGYLIHPLYFSLSSGISFHLKLGVPQFYHFSVMLIQKRPPSKFLFFSIVNFINSFSFFSHKPVDHILKIEKKNSKIMSALRLES